MERSTRFHRGLRLTAAFALLISILACGGSDDSPPPAPTNPTTPPPPPGTPAQPGAGRAFTLAPGFMPDPQRATGTAGGPFDASTRNTGCRGYIGATPNHTLNLTAPVPSLRILVSSAEDTTLVVQLADGTYLCNDDAEGLNPIVSGSFPAGLHRIYVGSYDRNARPQYTLGITELAQVTAASLQGGGPATPQGAVPPPTTGPGSSQVNLRPGFMPDPHTVRGVAGGPVRADTFQPDCRGLVPNAPQHTLTLGGDFRMLKIMVNSQEDTTLVVRDPQGRYRCNDDGPGEGLRPVIQGAFGPGTYQIWVGVFGGGTAPYTLGFTEIEQNRASNLPLP